MDMWVWTPERPGRPGPSAHAAAGGFVVGEGLAGSGVRCGEGSAEGYVVHGALAGGGDAFRQGFG